MCASTLRNRPRARCLPRCAVTWIAALAVAASGAQAGTAAAPPQLVNLRVAVGAYRLPGGATVSVFEQDAEFRFVNYQTGELRRLWRTGPSVFVAGPGVEVETPITIRISVGPARKGKAPWISVNGQRATRVTLASRPAQFASAGAALAGHLLALPGP